MADSHGKHVKVDVTGEPLLQPFWMLPALAILGLKARDIMGYPVTRFLAGFPAALIAVTLLAPHVTG